MSVWRRRDSSAPSAATTLPARSGVSALTATNWPRTVYTARTLTSATHRPTTANTCAKTSSELSSNNFSQFLLLEFFLTFCGLGAFVHLDSSKWATLTTAEILTSAP